jgi:hypothetical protein
MPPASAFLNCNRDAAGMRSAPELARQADDDSSLRIPIHAPLGQILISKGILSDDQLRIALLEQMKSNQPIGKLLVSLGFVSEATLRDALSESLGNRASICRTRSSTRRR